MISSAFHLSGGVHFGNMCYEFKFPDIGILAILKRSSKYIIQWVSQVVSKFHKNVPGIYLQIGLQSVPLVPQRVCQPSLGWLFFHFLIGHCKLFFWLLSAIVLDLILLGPVQCFHSISPWQRMPSPQNHCSVSSIFLLFIFYILPFSTPI